MRRLVIGRSVVAGALVAAVCVASPFSSSGRAEAASRSADAVPRVGKVPARFSGWKVKVTSDPKNQRVFTLTFNSPLLGQRVVNTVYLPTRYRAVGPKLPVVYALHGTAPTSACSPSTTSNPVSAQLTTPCGSGAFQDSLWGIASQASRMHFVVVSTDTSPIKAVCATCVWIDGGKAHSSASSSSTAKPMLSDSFLNRELIPLVQALLNVRSDRGGRGVIGFSMGGAAAYLQAMMHPDAYSYVGSVSGVYDIKDSSGNAVWNLGGYMRDQGYGTAASDPVWWQQFNPREMVGNIKGTHTALFLSSADGCLSPGDSASQFCKGLPVAGLVEGGAIEVLVRANMNAAMPELTAAHMPYTSVELPGVHGTTNAYVFAHYIVPEANARFAQPTPRPAAFHYRSAMPQFSIWGYQLSIAKAVDGFVTLTGAKTNGHAFTITGAGIASVVTPGGFAPNSVCRVQVRQGSTSRSVRIRANHQGRLTMRLTLQSSPTVVAVPACKA